jgi:hypothetical protein
MASSQQNTQQAAACQPMQSLQGLGAGRSSASMWPTVVQVVVGLGRATPSVGGGGAQQGMPVRRARS